MEFRDLEKVRKIIKGATDLDVCYAYDDLVFPDNVAFLIQFDDEDENNLFCYFHEDCLDKDREKIMESLKVNGKKNNCTLAHSGYFNLLQKGQNVEIQFL